MTKAARGREKKVTHIRIRRLYKVFSLLWTLPEWFIRDLGNGHSSTNSPILIRIFFFSSSSSNKNQKEKQKRKGIRKIPQEGFLIFIVVKEKGLTRKICQKLVIFLSFLLSVFYYGIFIVSATAKKKKEENVEEEDEE
jgi:hypothetical protein